MISAIAALISSNDNGVFNGTNNELPSFAQKVIVQLKATADAPILKQNKFKIPGTDIFAKVIDFLWRQLHRETVNFGVDGKLLVNYACSMAWANCHSGI